MRTGLGVFETATVTLASRLKMFMPVAAVTDAELCHLLMLRWSLHGTHHPHTRNSCQKLLFVPTLARCYDSACHGPAFASHEMSSNGAWALGRAYDSVPNICEGPDKEL